MNIQISDAAKFRADFLLKEFFTPFEGGRMGLGSIAYASVVAAAHVKKTIDALRYISADSEHIHFYEQVFHQLNCPYAPWRIELSE